MALARLFRRLGRAAPGNPGAPQPPARPALPAMSASAMSAAAADPGSMDDVLRQLEDDVFLTMRVITNASGNVQRQVDETLDELARTRLAGASHAALAGQCSEAADRLEEPVRILAAATRATARETAGAMLFLDDAGDLVQAATVHAGALAQEAQDITGLARTIETLSRQGNLLALNASLEASRSNQPTGGFSAIASESNLLAGRMRTAAGELAQRIAQLELTAAQNRLAMEKMCGVAAQLRQALAAAQEATDAQNQQGEVALAALQDHRAQARQLHEGAGVLAGMARASTSKIQLAQGGGLALTRLLERLTQRSVIFLRNSSNGNRRRLDRVPVKAPGEITWQGETRPALTLELSRGGCVLLAEHAVFGTPVRPGALARLRLEGIGSVTVTFLSLSELGWHVRFDRVDSLAAERIDALIARVHRENEPMVALAQATAAEVMRAFSHALDTGEIAQGDLLTSDYRPVEGSDPVQYVTRGLSFYECVLPPVLDGARRSALAPLFVVATDRNAYAPVHHPEFSQPQRPGEPVWNDLNARNRRIYDRWLTLTGARNRAPHSLRAYVRHQADGSPQPVQVIAAPVHVQGQFWGNIQVGCEL